MIASLRRGSRGCGATGFLRLTVSGIEWNGREKFYRYEAWLFYLITHFLKPWGYTLQGRVPWRGQDRRDVGTIHVAHNRILDFNPILESEDQGDEDGDRPV